MEKIKGQTLHSTPLDDVTLETSLMFVSKLITAVRNLHQIGTAHCDLNAANIMIRNNNVVILDFASSVDVTFASTCGISYPKTTWQVVAPEFLIAGSNAIIAQTDNKNMIDGFDNDTLTPLNKNNITSGCGTGRCVRVYNVQVDSCDMFAVGVASLSVMLKLGRSCLFSASSAFKYLKLVRRGVHGTGENIAAYTALELWGIYYMLGDISGSHSRKPNHMTNEDNIPPLLTLYERMMMKTSCWPPTNLNACAAISSFKQCPFIRNNRKSIQNLPRVHQHILISLLHPTVTMRCWPKYNHCSW